MTTKNQPSRATVVALCTRRLRALEAYVPSSATIGIEGERFDARSVAALYQRCLDAMAAVGTKRAEVKAAMIHVTHTDRARLDADAALKGWVRGEFGSRSQQAHDFGFPPPRVHVKTTEEKALAVRRGKATRKARHTLGRRQKEEIRGVVSGEEETPPRAP
jgi:hypothetical protein